MKVATPAATKALKHARTLATALLDHTDLLARVEARMTELGGDRLADPGARMVHEHLGAGGKRLRARLAIAACQALGGRAEDAVDWAAAVELLHNASLVHDDIQDGDRTRRGKPALWARYGSAQAINTGDLLLMLPFRALCRYPAEAQAALVQILAEYQRRLRQDRHAFRASRPRRGGACGAAGGRGEEFGAHLYLDRHSLSASG
jgi:geranylgeranyl pyrophosphate synthase